MDRSQLYVANLEALDRLRSIPLNLTADVDVGVQLEESATATHARLHGGGERWLRLHSERDPIGEAKAQLEQLSDGQLPKLLLVIGLGLGYVLEALEELEFPPRIVALEPSSALARAFLRRRDWRDWISSGRLALFVGPDYEALNDFGRSTEFKDQPPVLVNPVLARLRPAEVARARKRWSDAVFDARANADARVENAGRYLLNTLRNIPAVVRESDVSALSGCAAGSAALVVAAGPSLDQSMAELAALRDRAVVIAVDTAVRPLLAHGVAPDLVVSIDPSESNARHLADLPPLERTWLVAEASLDPRATRPFEGRTFLFTFGHHPWPWLASAGIRRGSLRAWGSVATSAFDLALMLGCNPIVFAGLDLAFTKARPYCRGTVYEEDWASALAWGGTLPDAWTAAVSRWLSVSEPDLSGADVASAKHLLAFRNWIVDQTTSATDRRFVNATGAGVLHGGRIELDSLHGVLERLQRVDLADRLREAYESGRGVADASRLRPALERLGAELEDPLVDDGGVAGEWQAFTTDRITAEAIGTAIDEAVEGLLRPTSAARRSLTLRDALPYRAEQVVKLCRLLTNPGALLPAEGGSTAAATGDALGRVLELLARLLDLDGSLAPGFVPLSIAPAANVSRVPVCHFVDWFPEAAVLARALDRAMVATIAEAVEVDVEDDASRFWAEPDDPIAPANGETAATREAADLARGDSLVRNELLRQVAILVAWACGNLDGGVIVRGPRARGWAQAALGRLLRAIVPTPRQLGGLGATAATAADRSPARYELIVSSDGDSASHVVVGSLDPSRLMRGLTGVLVATGGDASAGSPEPASDTPDDRLSIELSTSSTRSAARVALHLAAAPRSSDVRQRFLARPVQWLVPRLLSAEFLPASIFGYSTSADDATMTGLGARRSHRVDERGRATALDEWPEPIHAERPWGDDGGAVAWRTGRDPCLLWRQAAGAVVVTRPLTFTPANGAVTRDGRVWWASTSGGLWSWVPGRAIEEVAPAPPAFGLRLLSDDRIRLDPWTSDAAGFTERRLLRQAYVWTPGAEAVDTIELGPEGAAWSASTREGWMVEACPHADSIQCTHTSGTRASLACYFPVTVAWAGSSLVVVASTGGQVLLFEDLFDVLERMRGEG